MTLPNQRPYIQGNARRQQAEDRRAQAAKIHHSELDRPVSTTTNHDERDFGSEHYPGNFTKGLRHDEHGFVTRGYNVFVDEINRPANSGVAPDFSAADTDIPDQDSKDGQFFSKHDDDGNNEDLKLKWRGWESPRAGHYYSLQGPDADAIGMAPAPELGSDELAAEMAELYAMAMLRDIPFEDLTGNKSWTDSNSGITLQKVLDALNKISFFQNQNGSAFTKRRQAARLLESNQYDVATGRPHQGQSLSAFTGKNLFRGSGPGAKNGGFISQFMLVGNRQMPANGNFTDSLITYGAQQISQKSQSFKQNLDYMTNWNQWLEVQRGANLREWHVFQERRFITTPRDLATYVRFDALYQAYLNACLILLGTGFPFQPGFPDQNDRARTPFASFGGPHILSLVTEVATRCLKAARRQKFNFHRRARPERIGGLLSLGSAVSGSDTLSPERYGSATKSAIEAMLDTLGDPMRRLISKHNTKREENAGQRVFNSSSTADPDWLQNGSCDNLLLAMAYPEGSPMHPSYAAGHATVAGGCVTMLKAFFETLKADDTAKPWSDTELPQVRVKDSTGDSLETIPESDLDNITIEGELNKLASNISIGRNMAGVHYYSDYYDSLRMGERIAVGILLEQMSTYDEKVSLRFRSFDGDLIEISTSDLSQARINDGAISYRDWFFRHMES